MTQDALVRLRQQLDLALEAGTPAASADLAAALEAAHKASLAQAVAGGAFATLCRRHGTLP